MLTDFFFTWPNGSSVGAVVVETQGGVLWGKKDWDDRWKS